MDKNKVNNIIVEADLISPPKNDKKQAIKKTKKKSATAIGSNVVVEAYNTPIYNVYINMKLNDNNKRICLDILKRQGIKAYIEDNIIICGKFYDKYKASMLVSKIGSIGYISSIKIAIY